MGTIYRLLYRYMAKVLQMGRKGREKAKKRGETDPKKDKRSKNVPKREPEFEDKKSSVRLDVFDVINVLTRLHLRELVREYESVSYKHNVELGLPVDIPTCQDLENFAKKGTSRLETLKVGFGSRDILKKVERMTKGKKNRDNLSHDSLNKSCKRNPGQDHSNYDFNQMNSIKILEMHRSNIEHFTCETQYEAAGFDVNRLVVVPTAFAEVSILEDNVVINRILQETLFSLKDKELKKADEKEVRILSFGTRQDKSFLTFVLSIPDIHRLDNNDIVLRAEERSVSFYADHVNGTAYFLELSNLANSIIPASATYHIYESDRIDIIVEKRKRQFWKELFDANPKLKVAWYRQMEEVMESVQDRALIQEPIDQVWKISQIFVNGGIDLLKVPLELNHLRMQFESLEEMVYYYKRMIPVNPALRALIYMLGAALWKLITSTHHSRKSKKRKPLDEDHKQDVFKLLSNLHASYGENFIEGISFLDAKKYEEAHSYFRKALSNLDKPFLHIPLTSCLFEMGRYREGLIHAIFAIRNVGPIYGYEGLIFCLRYKVHSGYFITAIDKAISLEYTLKVVEPSKNLSYLKTAKKTALVALKNIFKAHSLIFRKEFQSALPILQYVDSCLTIKTGLSSVILLLLYYVTQKFEEAIQLGKLLLKDGTKYQNLVYYILGSSEYYLVNLDSAITYFEQVGCDISIDLNGVKAIKKLLGKAYEALSKNNLEVVRRCYNSVLQLSKGNDDMQSDIQAKLKAVNLLIDTNESPFPKLI